MRRKRTRQNVKASVLVEDNVEVVVDGQVMDTVVRANPLDIAEDC